MKLFLNRILFLVVLLAALSCKRRNTSVNNFANQVEETVLEIQNDSLNNIIRAQRRGFGNNSFKTTKANSILSWNIKDFGQSKSEIEINAIANIVKNFDLVLIQEVVAKHPGGAKAVARLADQLNRMGSKWDYRISDPTQSPSAYISERYAFLWKTAHVKLEGKAFLDRELAKVVYREPYIGKFKFKHSDEPVTIINYHSRKHDQKPEGEIKHFLNYKIRLSTKNLLLCGDFNLNEKHKVWESFYIDGFINTMSNAPTTLKRTCKRGRYLNYAIDNIYAQGDFNIIDSGTIDFVDNCSNLSKARLLSDHLPVYLIFN